MRTRATVVLAAAVLLAGCANAAEVADDATVATVWDALVREQPSIAAYQASMSCAVNADFARMNTALNDGDEVAFLPPVSGG